MKSPAAIPEKRVKETKVNVQEEIWKFIAATLKQGLNHLLEGLQIMPKLDGPDPVGGDKDTFLLQCGS
jgi:hypothetical protein